MSHRASLMPQWGWVLWEQRKCSSLEDVICWTSLKTTVTPAGQVKLFSCNELGREKRERPSRSHLDVCSLKVNSHCEGQQGQTYFIELKLNLMCSVDWLLFLWCLGNENEGGALIFNLSQLMFMLSHGLSSCSRMDKEMHRKRSKKH